MATAVEGMSLVDYVRAFSDRGECKCGRCSDVGPDRELSHAVNVGFFEVCKTAFENNEPDAEVLRSKILAHNGYYADVDVFDGKEHGYMELGGWVGDQGDALRLMGLGKLLGLWELMTPKSMLGDLIPEELQMQMAQSGMVTIQAGK